MAREIGNRKSPEKSSEKSSEKSEIGNQKSGEKSDAEIRNRRGNQKSPSDGKSEIRNQKSHRYGSHGCSPLYPVSDPTMAKALKKIMRESGVSIAELSRRTGVSTNTVSAIASAKRMGNIATWMAFARALGTTLSEIEKESLHVR